MKKIIITLAAVAAAFTMASCNKEQLVSSNENPTVGKSVLTASIENDLTKAHLDANGDDTDGYKVFWSAGDDLIVGGGLDEMGEYKNWVAEYKLEDSSAGSSQGTFSWQAENNTFISIDKECHEPSFEEGNMYMAIHPFDLIDMNTGAFTWRTEQTYNGTTGYIPMIAAAEVTEDGTADFIFTNLGGLLRLTVKGTATIKSITVKAKEPMSGEIDYFAMDEDGNIVALMGNDDRYETYNYINLDCGENGVALSSTGTDFYISMPCHYSVEEDEMSLGGYSEVTITLTDTKDNVCVKNLKNEKEIVIERSKITPATFTASEFKAPVPDGALSGEFSVSPTKKVYFSKGNLTATIDDNGAPVAWKFAANQYDYLEKGGANETIGTVAGDVDLFGWSTDATAYGISKSTSYSDYSGNFIDWGKAIDDKDIWRTLNMGEWQYLFNTSSRMANGKPCYSNAVNGVSIEGATYQGVFLYPDNYNGDVVDGNMTWEQITAAGIVFLPAARSRSGSNVGDADVYGRYWSSSTRSDLFAYHVYFSRNGIYTDSYDFFFSGYSVRLVTDVK